MKCWWREGREVGNKSAKETENLYCNVILISGGVQANVQSFLSKILFEKKRKVFQYFISRSNHVLPHTHTHVIKPELVMLCVYFKHNLEIYLSIFWWCQRVATDVSKETNESIFKAAIKIVIFSETWVKHCATIIASGAESFFRYR
jgi:hypothetical protein